MSRSFTQDEIRSLTDLTERLGRNSKMAVPAFALGILATLIGAGIAIYYIFTLSAQLESANLELKQTEAVLEDTNRSLASANEALTSVQNDQGAVDTEIAEAIMQVEQSQEGVATAKRNVSSATIALPTQSQRTAARVPTANLSGEWVDGYGTVYLIEQQGNAFRYSARFIQSTGRDSGIAGTAEGSVNGRSVDYKYSDNIGRVLNCRGDISVDRRSLAETCTDPDGKVTTVTLVRT